VFDCAEGTQLQLQRSHLKQGQIERIFVTHMHADHTVGLVPLLLSGIQSSAEDRQKMKALGTKKQAKINIYGPPGLRLMIRQMLNLTALSLGDVYAVHELIPSLASCTGNSFFSTSPNAEGNGPSCPCEASDLHDAEACGHNIVADEDGCWRDILRLGESTKASDGNAWRVDAGPLQHRGQPNVRE
jgi:ribonuclease Z